MSIVTYYARMSLPELEQLRADRQGLAALYASPPAGGELLDLDKASDTISWLLSPCKRAEQLHYAAQMTKVMNDAQYDPNTLPPIPPLDDFAIAVEGRGPNKDRRLDLGLGPACIFQPEEVKRYAALLSKVDESVLRVHLDFPQMDRLYFAIDTWQDEGEELFLEYVVPLFERLKQFYRAAADAGQYVLVWCN